MSPLQFFLFRLRSCSSIVELCKDRASWSHPAKCGVRGRPPEPFAKALRKAKQFLAKQVRYTVAAKPVLLVIRLVQATVDAGGPSPVVIDRRKCREGRRQRNTGGVDVSKTRRGQWNAVELIKRQRAREQQEEEQQEKEEEKEEGTARRHEARSGSTLSPTKWREKRFPCDPCRRNSAPHSGNRFKKIMRTKDIP